MIVSLRYSGDVLLSTPLALSIKTQMPEAVVDYLVFEGTQDVLCNNPYVRNVLTIPPESKNIRFFMSLFKRYDYAIGTNDTIMPSGQIRLIGPIFTVLMPGGLPSGFRISSPVRIGGRKLF